MTLTPRRETLPLTPETARYYTIAERHDGRLEFVPFERPATWRTRALDVVAALGIAAGLYLVTAALVVLL